MAVRVTLRVRQIVNVVNLSTPVGVLVALLGGGRLAPGPDGLILARGYALPLPPAPAFTVGNVVVLKMDDGGLPLHPRLLAHEGRHATQYAYCLGLGFVPLYLVLAGWSWLRVGDFASHNVFERWAGLEDGGYLDRRQGPRRRPPSSHRPA